MGFAVGTATSPSFGSLSAVGVSPGEDALPRRGRRVAFLTVKNWQPTTREGRMVAGRSSARRNGERAMRPRLFRDAGRVALASALVLVVSGASPRGARGGHISPPSPPPAHRSPHSAPHLPSPSPGTGTRNTHHHGHHVFFFPYFLGDPFFWYPDPWWWGYPAPGYYPPYHCCPN